MATWPALLETVPFVNSKTDSSSSSTKFLKFLSVCRVEIGRLMCLHTYNIAMHSHTLHYYIRRLFAATDNLGGLEMKCRNTIDHMKLC